MKLELRDNGLSPARSSAASTRAANRQTKGTAIKRASVWPHRDQVTTLFSSCSHLTSSSINLPLTVCSFIMHNTSFGPPPKRRKFDTAPRQRIQTTATSSKIMFREDTNAPAVFVSLADPSIPGWEPPESLEYVLDRDGTQFDAELETEAFESEAWRAAHTETVPPAKGRSRTSVRKLYSTYSGD